MEHAKSNTWLADLKLIRRSEIELCVLQIGGISETDRRSYFFGFQSSYFELKSGDWNNWNFTRVDRFIAVDNVCVSVYFGSAAPVLFLEEYIRVQ